MNKRNYYYMSSRIRTRRKELNISLGELAEKLNISISHLSKIEKAQSIPSLDLFCDICDILNVSPDYLLLGNISINNIHKNIIDNLRLCNNDDLEIINQIIAIYSSRNNYTSIN